MIPLIKRRFSLPNLNKPYLKGSNNNGSSANNNAGYDFGMSQKAAFHLNLTEEAQCSLGLVLPTCSPAITSPSPGAADLNHLFIPSPPSRSRFSVGRKDRDAAAAAAKQKSAGGGKRKDRKKSKQPSFEGDTMESGVTLEK